MDIPQRKSYVVSSANTLASMIKKHGVTGFVLWSDGAASVYLGLSIVVEIDKDTWEIFNLQYDINRL